MQVELFNIADATNWGMISKYKELPPLHSRDGVGRGLVRPEVVSKACKGKMKEVFIFLGETN